MIWLNSIPSEGRYYDVLNMNASFSANTNTQLTRQSVTITSETTKVLIMAQGNISLSSLGAAYASIGRHTSAGPSTSTINLARSGITMSDSLVTGVNRMWGGSSRIVQTTVNCSLIDTPGIGTWWYSLWVHTTVSADPQNVTIIILKVFD